MSTAGNLTPANKIDDSRWEHGRVKTGDLALSSPSHEAGVVLHYISCPPPEGTKPKGTILLIHGFPQTSYQFRRVITPLADAGYHIFAPDYRGAGESSKPWDGYTKDVMARDLDTALEKVGIEGKAHVVGHDIGGMIAHAFAVLFPEKTASLAFGECPLPGTQFYQDAKQTLTMWHFTFHSIPDLPELLITGRERIYLKHFFDRLSQNPAAISTHDLDVYATAYAQPGSMRAGLNTYRAFEQDGADNQRWKEEKGKSKVRCLALWGGKSFADEKAAKAMAGEFYENVEFASAPGAGHWVAEEKPKEFVEILLKWFEQSSSKD